MVIVIGQRSQALYFDLKQLMLLVQMALYFLRPFNHFNFKLRKLQLSLCSVMAVNSLEIQPELQYCLQKFVQVPVVAM